MTDSIEELDKAQKNQKEVGSAESNLKTDEPADNLREETAEAVNEDEDSSGPT